MFLELGSGQDRPDRMDALLKALANHVGTLCEHLFLSCKPPRPAQARWTGVPAVSKWCLCFSLFHQLLDPLLSSLASGGKVPGSGGDADGGTAPVLDNDARASGLIKISHSSSKSQSESESESKAKERDSLDFRFHVP